MSVFERLGSSLLAAGVLLGSACATSSDTRPHAMSASAHEDAAAEHARAAATHDAAAVPPAVEERGGCTARRLGVQICWTSTRVHQDEHAVMAEEHRRIAAEHRAASAVLRQAEATACRDVSPEDRDMSPFAQTEDLDAVGPLYETSTVAKSPSQLLVGASILFRPVPGLTRDRLQRIVDCHLARNAALGHQDVGMPDCPLVPAGVRATVVPDGDALLVNIRADDPTTAAEVLARAERLLQRGRRSRHGSPSATLSFAHSPHAALSAAPEHRR